MRARCEVRGESEVRGVFNIITCFGTNVDLIKITALVWSCGKIVC